MELTKKPNGEKCVDLRPRTTQFNYVVVEKGGGCSSFIGRIGGAQRMSLASGCVTRHGTIMHEFLHALGFYHEQSRGDRDEFVRVNYDNIIPGRENNFRKLVNGVSIDHLETTYDYGSVMHYGRRGFAIDPSQDTITPLDPSAEIGQRITLSELDIERVQILYGCLNAVSTIYEIFFKYNISYIEEFFKKTSINNLFHLFCRKIQNTSRTWPVTFKLNVSIMLNFNLINKVVYKFQVNLF